MKSHEKELNTFLSKRYITDYTSKKSSSIFHPNLQSFKSAILTSYIVNHK